MIQLEHVSKIYATPKGEVKALDDVTLEAAKGEFVAVRGPSGCGKSTLLTIVGGLAAPTSGVVRVAGHELSQMSAVELAAFRAETIGFVFQMFHLLPYLNIVENVLVAANSAARPHAAKRGRIAGSFSVGPPVDPPTRPTQHWRTATRGRRPRPAQ